MPARFPHGEIIRQPAPGSNAFLNATTRLRPGLPASLIDNFLRGHWKQCGGEGELGSFVAFALRVNVVISPTDGFRPPDWFETRARGDR